MDRSRTAALSVDPNPLPALSVSERVGECVCVSECVSE